MSDKENTMAARWGLGGEISQVENSRRQDRSSGVWVLQIDKQATRVGMPEIIVGRREEPARDTSPRGLARTGLFSMGHGGDE